MRSRAGEEAPLTGLKLVERPLKHLIESLATGMNANRLEVLVQERKLTFGDPSATTHDIP